MMLPPYPAPVTEWHNDTYDAISPTRPESSQAGRTIVITGAGRGIGREVAIAFAEAGAATIHILGRTKHTLEAVKSEIEKSHANVKVFVYKADIGEASQVEQAAKAIGVWDVLIANAGYIPKPSTIEQSDVDEWWKTFETNVKGNYHLVRSFLPYKKRGGTIVAYSSGFAFLPPSLPPLLGSSAYSVSKMGTARFYEFVAEENPDVNVFVLQPGIVRTELYEKGELKLDDTLDSIRLPAHFTVWLTTHAASSLSGRFLFANWDVEQLRSSVATRIKSDPLYLTTSLGGFPFK